MWVGGTWGCEMDQAGAQEDSLSKLGLTQRLRALCRSQHVQLFFFLIALSRNYIKHHSFTL